MSSGLLKDDKTTFFAELFNDFRDHEAAAIANLLVDPVGRTEYQLGSASRALAATHAKLVIQSMLMATIPVVIVLMFTSRFATIFYPNFEPETTAMIRSGLLIVAVFYPIKAFGIVLRNGVLRSGGDVAYVFKTELLALLPVGCLAYFLGWYLGLGLNGILLGGFMVEAVKCGLYWWRLTSGRWIHISQA